MSELNYEEIDQAVNSLIDSQDKTVLPLAEDQSPDYQPPKNTPVREVEPKKIMLPNRRGRLGERPAAAAKIVDIMAAKVPSRAPSRFAPTMQPVITPKPAVRPKALEVPVASQPEKLEPTPTANAALPASPEQAIVSKAPGPTLSVSPHSEIWPDPLDFDQGVEPVTELESPFIPGTKVEKRPLGAFASVPAAMANPEQKNPEDVAMPAQTVTIQQTAPLSSPIVPDQTLQPAEPLTPEPTQPPPQDSNNTTMAIPQQYKAVQKQAGDSPRPVFDTKEYHPPLMLEKTAQSGRGRRVIKYLILSLVLVILIIVGYIGFASLSGYLVR